MKGSGGPQHRRATPPERRFYPPLILGRFPRLEPVIVSSNTSPECDDYYLVGFDFFSNVVYHVLELRVP
jgi:hypothetical protein